MLPPIVRPAPPADPRDIEEWKRQVFAAVLRVVDLANELLSRGIFHNGVRLDGVALTTSNTEVHHGLGVVPGIIQPIKLSAGVTIFTDTPHADPQNFIYLKATASVTANLLLAA